MSFVFVTFCCAFAALGSFLIGYDSGLVSLSIEQEALLRQFGSPDLASSDAAIGGIVSSYIGGAIVGSLLAPYTSDSYGRRMVLFVGGLLATLGAALQGGAINIAMLVAGRCIAGLAVGQMSATIPVYCSEVSPPRIRGMLAGMQNWMIALGVLVAQWVRYGSSHQSGPFSWRFPLSLQVAPGIILACGTWFLPESPRWLISQGRQIEGRSALARLNKSTNRHSLDHEFPQIQTTLASQAHLSSSWHTLFAHPWRRRTLLATSLQLFTQCTGIALLQTSSPLLSNPLNLPSSTTLTLLALSTALSLLWNTLFMPLLDKLPRRTLLIPSLLATGATLCIQATLLTTKTPNPNILRTALAIPFLFTLSSTLPALLSWIYQTELFPTRLRARGSALATATYWSAKLILAHASPIAFHRIGYKYLYCFAGMTWAAAVVVWAWYPETGGMSLEGVEGGFGDDEEVRSVRSFGGNGHGTVSADSARRSQIRQWGLHPLSMHPTCESGSVDSGSGEEFGLEEKV